MNAGALKEIPIESLREAHFVMTDETPEPYTLKTMPLCILMQITDAWSVEELAAEIRRREH